MKVALNFEAVTEVVTELPKPKTPEIEALYNKIKNKNQGKFSAVKIEPAELEDDELPF